MFSDYYFFLISPFTFSDCLFDFGYFVPKIKMKCFAPSSWLSGRELQPPVHRHILPVITADINPLNFQVSKLAVDKMKGWMISMS